MSSTNPQTGKPFDLKKIRSVFSEDCYDLGPEHPWRYRTKKKVFLTADLREQRYAMCRWFLAWVNFTAAWFYNNVVWIDPCASILPTSYKQWLRQKQALSGDKEWISDDAKMEDPNLRGRKTALHQCSWEGKRMNWVITLTRGQVGVDILPEDWTLDGPGMATVVRRLEERLRDMLDADCSLPGVIMSDRGAGMFAPSGLVVAAYEQAVRDCNFRLLWGADAKQQSPDMPDLLLHETAVGWLRGVLRRTKPEVKPWLETPAQWSRWVMKALDEVDHNYDAEGLCQQFSDRVEECFAAEGERLSY